MNLVLGICLLTFGWMATTESSVPTNTKTAIEQLKEHYKTRETKFGNPLFYGKLKNFETAEQKFLMGLILDAYNRILTHMEHEEKNEDVQKDLIKLKEYLNNLNVHYFSDKHKDLEKFATEVLALKEADPGVQRKAVFEVQAICNDAMKLLNPPSPQSHRRRRQAKHSKKQQSKS